jgi:hypothetical protein
MRDEYPPFHLDQGPHDPPDEAAAVGTVTAEGRQEPTPYPPVGSGSASSAPRDT